MLKKMVKLHETTFKNSKGDNELFSVKKAEIQEQFSTLFSIASNEVLPVVEKLNALVKEGIVTEKQLATIPALKAATSLIKASKGKCAGTIDAIYRSFNNLIILEQKINKEIGLCFKSASTTDKTISPRELSVVDMLTTLNFFVTYTSDLMLLVSFEIRGGCQLNKKFIAKVNKCASEYGSVVDLLEGKDFEKRVDVMDKLSGINIGEAIVDASMQAGKGLLVTAPAGALAAADSILEGIGNMLTSADLGFFASSSVGATSNFIGNPIYHIRLWWTEFQHSRYESLKANKQATEAIILDLRLKEEGTNDPSLDKQIKYYEDKLTSIQYKIDQYEKDL